MRFFLDCEFNGFGGDIISLALVPESGGAGLSFVFPCVHPKAWVKQNVIPNLYAGHVSHTTKTISKRVAAQMLTDYLNGFDETLIIADWPEDFALFCGLLITKPGEMVPLQQLNFSMRRIQSYPTDLADAVQHNAFWDACALRRAVTKKDAEIEALERLLDLPPST